MAVSDRVLLMMKNKFAKFASNTCDIYAPTDLRDEYGAPAGPPVISASGVACRLITLDSGKAKKFADKTIMEDAYQLTIAIGTVIDVGYLVDVDGDRYEVVAITDKLTDGVYIFVEMRRMRS